MCLCAPSGFLIHVHTEDGSTELLEAYVVNSRCDAMRALLVLLLAGSTRAVFDFGETWGKFAEQVQETTDKIK